MERFLKFINVLFISYLLIYSSIYCSMQFVDFFVVFFRSFIFYRIEYINYFVQREMSFKTELLILNVITPKKRTRNLHVVAAYRYMYLLVFCDISGGFFPQIRIPLNKLCSSIKRNTKFPRNFQRYRNIYNYIIFACVFYAADIYVCLWIDRR